MGGQFWEKFWEHKNCVAPWVFPEIFRAPILLEPWGSLIPQERIKLERKKGRIENP